MPKYSIEVKPQPDPKKTGEWYFTVKSKRNGKTVIPVEGHNNLDDLLLLIYTLRNEFATASIYITGKDGVRRTVAQHYKKKGHIQHAFTN